MYDIGFVLGREDGSKDVFVDGQKWGLVSATEAEDGWYVLARIKIKIDKKGVERVKYKVIGDKIDDTQVRKILNIAMGTTEGIKSIVSEYAHLVPASTRADTRYKDMIELMRIMDNFDINTPVVSEMRAFMNKLCNTIKVRIIGDMAKKYDEEKEAKEEE